MTEKRQLTDKQAAFVLEYCVDWNATQAAIRAGYSEQTARSIGSELLTKPDIAAEIDARRQEYYAGIGFTRERVAQELAKLATSDVRGLLTPDGHLVPIHELDDATAASISSVELVTNPLHGQKDDEGRTIVEHTTKIKLWPKLQALDQISKNLGSYTEKVDVNVKGLNITIGDKDADCC